MRRLARTLDAWLLERLNSLSLGSSIRTEADVTSIRLRRTSPDASAEAIVRSTILFLLSAAVVASVLAVNDRFQRHPLDAQTYLTLCVLLSGVWAVVGLFGSIAEAHTRGLVITLDADAIRLDGEFLLDGRPTRGTFGYARAEVVRVVPQHGNVELEIVGIGSIVIGRFWTVAPRFAPVARAILEWHQQPSLPVDQSTPLPQPAPALNYATPSAECGVHVVRTPGTVRLIVAAFSKSRRASQSFHQRWPGVSLLGSWLVAAVPKKGPAVRDRVQPAALELVLTPQELWVISRTELHDQFERYRRADVVEFRRNRFGDGLYLRVANAFAGDLPGTGRIVTPLVLEVFGPLLPAHVAPAESATQRPA